MRVTIQPSELVEGGARLRQAQPTGDIKTSTASPAINQTAILIGLMAPSIMSGLYGGMFSVAVPAIRDDLGIQADMAAWVTTMYTLPFMMFMPLYGRLGDVFGKRQLFLIGTIIFMLGTALAGSAPNLGWLMAGRAIQGFGTAGFVPLALTMITQLFPADQRGKLMGTWNLAYPITGIFGPLLSGMLIDDWGWRAIFWPVLIIGVVAYWVASHQIPTTNHDTAPALSPTEFIRRFDWGGVILLGLMSTALLFYASSRPITGVPALQDWRLLLLTIALFSGFILWERRQQNPFVPLALYTSNTFTLSSVCAGLRMFTMAGLRFLSALYLVDIHDQSAYVTGLVIMAHAIPLVLFLRIGGQLADRWGSRWPVVISMVAQAAALFYLAWLPAESSVWMVAAGVVGQSLGASLSLAALHRSSIMDVPQEQMGVAAGLYSMMRFAGMVFGTALSGVVLQMGLDRGLPTLDAYQIAFGFVAVVTLLGAFLGSRLRG